MVCTSAVVAGLSVSWTLRFSNSDRRVLAMSMFAAVMAWVRVGVGRPTVFKLHLFGTPVLAASCIGPLGLKEAIGWPFTRLFGLHKQKYFLPESYLDSCRPVGWAVSRCLRGHVWGRRGGYALCSWRWCGIQGIVCWTCRCQLGHADECQNFAPSRLGPGACYGVGPGRPLHFPPEQQVFWWLSSHLRWVCLSTIPLRFVWGLFEVDRHNTQVVGQPYLCRWRSLHRRSPAIG